MDNTLRTHVLQSDLKTINGHSILGKGENIDLTDIIKEKSQKYTESFTEPENPKLGDEWFDLNEGKLFKRISDGTTHVWLDFSSSSVSTGQIKYAESPTEPTDPIIGDEWYNPVDDVLYKRMNKNNVEGWYAVNHNHIK